MIRNSKQIRNQLAFQETFQRRKKMSKTLLQEKKMKKGAVSSHSGGVFFLAIQNLFAKSYKRNFFTFLFLYFSKSPKVFFEGKLFSYFQNLTNLFFKIPQNLFFIKNAKPFLWKKGLENPIKNSVFNALKGIFFSCFFAELKFLTFFDVFENFFEMLWCFINYLICPR